MLHTCEASLMNIGDVVFSMFVNSLYPAHEVGQANRHVNTCEHERTYERELICEYMCTWTDTSEWVDECEQTRKRERTRKREQRWAQDRTREHEHDSRQMNVTGRRKLDCPLHQVKMNTRTYTWRQTHEDGHTNRHVKTDTRMWKQARECEWTLEREHQADTRTWTYTFTWKARQL